MAQVLASDYQYTNIPVSYRVTFKNLEGNDTYFTWNGFDSPASRPFNLFYMDCEGGVNETGSFNLIIEDSDNQLQRDRVQFAKVYIELGRTQSEFETFIVGFADIFTPRRPRSFYLEHQVSGPGTRVQSSELMLLIRKATDKKNNPDYQIGNLVEESITGRKWRPLNKGNDDIERLTHWNTGGIDKPNLNRLNYNLINEVFTTHADFMERMAAITGANWFIDYSQAKYPFNNDDDEIFTMKHPTLLHSGVTVKSGDLKLPNDDGRKTAYILSSFQVEDNATVDANVATRLYTTNIIEREVVAGSMSNQGSTKLVSRAIAQQFLINNDERRITDVSFILSKVGEPESPNSRVNGDMVLDNGDNTPSSRVIATFKIDLSDIKETPETIFVNDINVKVRFLQGSNKVWIRLFQRSGKEGDPNSDADNTIRWHHNGITSTVQEGYSATSTNKGGDYKNKDTATWNKTNTGPTYSFEIFSHIRRLLSRTNQNAAKILRMKEAFVDTSFINDPTVSTRLLSKVLSERSKARRTISEFQVTNPIGFLFRPYQWVSFSDGLSNTFQDLQVQRARYVINATAGDQSPFGTDSCSITLGGSYNALLGSCSCL
jgi:hypothetical protein